jgi:hypothetical protein
MVDSSKEMMNLLYSINHNYNYLIMNKFYKNRTVTGSSHHLNHSRQIDDILKEELV